MSGARVLSDAIPSSPFAEEEGRPRGTAEMTWPGFHSHVRGGARIGHQKHKQQKPKPASGTASNSKAFAQGKNNQQNAEANYRLGENICKPQSV